MLLRAVFLMALTSSGSCTNFHTYDKQVASPCDSSHYLDNMVAVASAALKAPATSVQKALEQAGQMSIQASQVDGDERTAAQLAANMAVSSGAASIDTALREWDNEIAGIIAASKLAATNAIIDEFRETRTGDLPAISQAGPFASGATLAVQTTVTPNDNGFFLQAQGTLKQTATPEATHSAAKSIFTYAIKAKQKAVDGNGENMVCLLDSAKNVSGQTCGTTATAIGYKGGRLLEATQIKLTKNPGDTEQNYADTAESGIVPDKATINQLSKQIAHMEQEATKLTMAASVSLEASVIDTATKDAIARYLTDEKADYNKNKNDVDNFITNHFGEGGKNIKEQLGPKVEQMKPTKAATGGNGYAKLTDLVRTEELKKA
uniref:Variant surface glycoprotein 1125.5120 n=1 Tax=Trypanosoma brucei TaxID=5691 RepID=A0A1J0RBN5_9TRYP|nr:variant surface glycoprotein 1125.5120 [Trypanosoma brucei]